ncbi:MAG: hypothetical protein O3C51_00850 [Planctomycetota bacterium]|nr:hypothetical protein [Planctomycetota bacterium]MDA1221790.1 hypothetical protein [Planctomycetota bacterium]
MIRAPSRSTWSLALVGLAIAGIGVSLDFAGASPVGTSSAAMLTGVPSAPANPGRPGTTSEEIDRARREGIASLDLLIAGLVTRASDASPEDLHALAEAHLERSLLRDIRKGMAVGRPTHAELPEELADDVDAGVRAAEQAIAAGDDSAEIHRILSALLSRRVTGIAAALKLRGRIEAELQLAEERDPAHPKVLIARGCGQLFAPNRLFGHDPAAAEAKFLRAAEGLPTDERPWMFASMCAWLLGDAERALSHIDAAVARNPAHPYIVEVARRLREGTDDPFGPDA